VSTALETPDTADRFSATIRELTVQDHRDAEGSALMRELVEGTLAPERLGEMLAQLLVVYRALESVGERLAGDPVIAPFLMPGLTRVAALEDDVRALLGADALDDLAVRAETTAYADRIEETAAWPAGYVAHHYTRYLGDLSGGQFIRRAVDRAYPDLGVRFFTFEEVASPKALKDQYRANLDATPWDDAERDRVVAEIRRAYALNTTLFNALDHPA